MSIMDYFSDWPTAWTMALRPLLIGSVITIMSALLSVIVVLKRLSFAGQGISHSAFGGIGVAAVLSSLIAVATKSAGEVGVGSGGLFEFVIVVLFCIGAALAMARVGGGDNKAVHIDTGIGLLLVAAMALGGLLVDVARRIAEANGLNAGSRTWESVLFGSVLVSDNQDLVIAGVVLLIVAAALWWWRRPVLFWTFDEQAAPVFGVPSGFCRTLLMVLLTVVVVTSMRLAGVVLATALLVLPGAIALRLSVRLGQVLLIACVAGLASLVVALAVALMFNVQPGPCLVIVMTVAYFAAGLVRPKHDRKVSVS